MKKRNPTFEEIQSFFNAEYAYLKKWIAVKEPDWDLLIEEARDIYGKHEFQFCLDRINSTIELIEKLYMESEEQNA